MKNFLIVTLVVVVLALGGWIAYDKVMPRDNSSITNGTSTSDQSTQPKSSSTLDLSDRGLIVVGPDIYNKSDTTTLILSNNNIQTLPSQIGNLTKLEVFKIDHNRLDGSLVGEVRKMPLKTLDVSYNNLTGMPAEIGQLNKLETLNYSYNKITGLPNELANLKDNLKELNLTGNPLGQESVRKAKAALPHTKVIF